MQIVIEIPECVKQDFDKATEDDIHGCYYDYNGIIGRAIKNGVPLPKGHGRLIDADYVTKDLNTLQDSFVINIPYEKSCAISIACCAPTIIEADAIAEREE